VKNEARKRLEMAICGMVQTQVLGNPAVSNLDLEDMGLPIQ
jgi:hypothetical protein